MKEARRDKEIKKIIEQIEPEIENFIDENWSRNHLENAGILYELLSAFNYKISLIYAKIRSNKVCEGEE